MDSWTLVAALVGGVTGVVLGVAIMRVIPFRRHTPPLISEPSALDTATPLMAQFIESISTIHHDSLEASKQALTAQRDLTTHLIDRTLGSPSPSTPASEYETPTMRPEEFRDWTDTFMPAAPTIPFPAPPSELAGEFDTAFPFDEMESEGG